MEELRRLVDTGTYLGATRRFEELRRSGDHGVHDLAEIYRLASVAYHGINDIYTARHYGRSGAELAQEVGDVDLQLRLWSYLVELERLAGDTVEALKYGERWLQTVANICPDRCDGRGELHYNLALVCRQRREHEAAITHFYQAMDYLRNHPKLTYYLMAAQMTAWEHYEYGELSHGDVAAAEAQRILAETPSDQEALKEQLLLQALRAYTADDWTHAAPLCEEVLADPHITYIQQFWANLLAAGCAVKSHPLAGPRLARDVKASGLHFSAQALDIATRLRRAELINRANEIQRAATALPDSIDQAG